MFKKTIKFEDFDGNEQTEDFYFHISKTEFLAMAADGDDMKKRIERIVAEKDGKKIIHEFRELIKLSVGVRSEDGKRFLKDEVSQSTMIDSPAFDELVMELATSAGAASEFVSNLLPEKMQKEMLEQLKKSDAADPLAEPEDTRPAYQKESRHPTDKELGEMTKPEMAAAMAWLQQRNK